MPNDNDITSTLDNERIELATLVRDSTDKNRQFFIVYLDLWVYVLLMVFGTADQMLLVPTVGIRLPLVDVTIPLLGFYWAHRYSCSSSTSTFCKIWKATTTS